MSLLPPGVCVRQPESGAELGIHPSSPMCGAWAWVWPVYWAVWVSGSVRCVCADTGAQHRAWRLLVVPCVPFTSSSAQFAERSPWLTLLLGIWFFLFDAVIREIILKFLFPYSFLVVYRKAAELSFPC